MSNNLFRFLRWFCPPELLEEIEGDLIQKFEKDLHPSDRLDLSEEYWRRRAKRRLIWNALRFFRPGIILRNKFSIESNKLPMFRNYFITSLRHIRKSKVNFAFKLGGLSLAIFSFLAIAIYVAFQFSFDTFHVDHQNIYRVNTQRKENGVIEKYAFTPYALGPVLQQHIPEVTSMVRIRYANATYIRLDKELFDCESLLAADSSLFNVLTFRFIKGDRTALQNPNSIVLTRTMSNKLFGTTDVLQRTLNINNDPNLYQVTAVIDDTEPNSHLFLNAVIPIPDQHEFSSKSIMDPVVFVDDATTLFVRLSKPITLGFMGKVEAALDPYIKKSDRKEYGFEVSFQPIADVYLGPTYRNDYFRKGSPVYVYAFSVLGILLLVVAGINYVNLSIADFNSRSQETGVRKVLGARKYQLVTQVVLETIVFSTISLGIGLLLLYLMFPQITQLLDSDLRFSMLLDKRMLLLASAGFLALVVFSSWLPASRFAKSGITQNLKSIGSGYNSTISQALLFTQFFVSSICICCTLIAGQQVAFIHNKGLGIDRKNLLVFSLPEDFTVEKVKVLKHKLKEVTGVIAVSNSSFRMGSWYWKDWYTVETKDGMKDVELYEVFSDDELFATLGIKLLDGRTFDANMPSDSGAAFVINETAARELGWTQPVGKRIYTHPEEKGKWDGTVVGVVSDINISPLYDKVRPLVMRLPWQNSYPDAFMYVRYQGNEQSIIEAVGSVYKEVNPGYPFAFRFVDELYNSQHQKENKAFTSLQFSTSVIVLISMLGIFSMAAYISVKRTKEFGIRKVLGASVPQIAKLHLGYFLKLVAIANLIALPVAYWLILEWLDGFAYKIDPTALTFIIVGVISIILVVFSGAYSAWKSGNMNPVDVIKIQ